jgi:hypothetical protein
MPVQPREFRDGKMIVDMPNGKQVEFTIEQIEKCLSMATKNLENVTNRKARIGSWLEQAKASL